MGYDMKIAILLSVYHTFETKSINIRQQQFTTQYYKWK